MRKTNPPAEPVASYQRVEDLVVYANARDLLQDIFIYLDYVRTHEIKRMVRTNQLPKPDSLRIARLLGDPEIEQAVKETGGAAWIDFIDALTHKMDLVSYDTKGEYRGYNSASPTYQDNYMLVSEQAYRQFIDLEPAAQEKKLLAGLVAENRQRDYDNRNEFYTPSVIGVLDSFYSWGAATGVMPSINFAAIRTFLLEKLARCQPGVWYSTESLIANLKTQHRYFLIPEKLKPDRWGKLPERYSNFIDGDDPWNTRTHVPANAPDAFERVEGRYVERFLEGIPLILRFVDVAYSAKPYQGPKPMQGHLKAFRVNERFIQLMQEKIPPPRVTVQPNFDVVVESALYSARLLQTLERLAECVSAPNSGVAASVVTFQLKKERIAAELVRDPQLDVVALLREMTGRELPGNVVTELEEWSGHAEQFTLYRGFSLVEHTEALPEKARQYVVETIAPNLSLVRYPDTLIEDLEKGSLAPLWVYHKPEAFAPLPETAQTCFPRLALLPTRPEPRSLLLERSTSITLKFLADPQAFDDFRKALAEARCPVQADARTFTITFDQVYQALFEQVQQQLAEFYTLSILDTVR